MKKRSIYFLLTLLAIAPILYVSTIYNTTGQQMGIYALIFVTAVVFGLENLFSDRKVGNLLAYWSLISFFVVTGLILNALGISGTIFDYFSWPEFYHDMGLMISIPIAFSIFLGMAEHYDKK